MCSRFSSNSGFSGELIPKETSKKSGVIQGICLDVYTDYLRKLVSIKGCVSFRETLGRSNFSALRLIRLSLLDSEILLLKVVLKETW